MEWKETNCNHFSNSACDKSTRDEIEKTNSVGKNDIKWSRNAAFDGSLTLFDMFYIHHWLANRNQTQNVCRPPTGRQLQEIDGNKFTQIIGGFYSLPSTCGIRP